MALIELACHTKACAPPPIGTGGSIEEVSTRVIKAAGKESPLRGMGTRLSEIPTEVAVSQAAAIVSNVAGFGRLKSHPGLKKNASEEDQKAAVNAVVSQMADNVLEVFDRDTQADVDRQWYDAANRLSKDWGAQYGMHPDHVSAVIASLSPQRDWDDNVQQARSVLEFMSDRKNQRLSTNDIRAVNRIAAQQHSKALAAWRNKVARAEKEGNETTIAKAKASKPQPPEPLDLKTTMELADLDDTQVSYLIRDRSGTPVTPTMQLTGDGGYVFGPPAQTRSGEDTKVRWTSYSTLANAVSIIRDPSPENVSARLGSGHKVRSFYNNIAYPTSSQGDVTADTHAFGIAFRIPVTQSHTTIATSRGSANIYGRPSNAGAGTQGVHVLVAEAYRQAASRVNRRKGTSKKYSPREMQSATWAQWRRDYPAEIRADRRSVKGSMSQTEDVLRQADANPSDWPAGRVSQELARIRAWRPNG
jgi:hypothetical protein